MGVPNTELVALEFPESSAADALLERLVELCDSERESRYAEFPEHSTLVVRRADLNWWMGRIADLGYPTEQFKTESVFLAGDLPSDEVAELRRRKRSFPH
jgi:hypothetical protein